MVLMVSASEYNPFDDEKGVHRQGISYKVFPCAFSRTAQNIRILLKFARAQRRKAERAYENVGKMFDGSVLYDRFGRFCGISC